jgi:alkanesulfonate monooxygenase SsuD/methylene tetrahydromethanopterin reductase-like flavin-dependent oxidoreductase (luciferase family)
MDEKLIASAAEAAVNDLQLDCQVASIYRRKDDWCVKFSGSYREFCDEFRSRFGEENSAEVVREKIKRHLLKSPKPTGRRKGVSNRSAMTGPESSLLDIPLQIAGGAPEQATRIAGEIINGTVNAAETAIKTVSDAAIAASQAAPDPPQLQTGIIISASDSPRSSIAKIPPAATKRAANKATKRATKRATKGAGKKAAKASKKTARKTSRKKA